MWKRNEAFLTWQQYAGERLYTYSQAITRSLEDGKQKNSIYALDGVRGLACLGVVMFHLNLWTFFSHVWYPYLDNGGALFSSLALFGESGVFLFFILSGFLLFMPFAKAMLFGSDWPSLRRFYLRRIFRILPGYYVTLFLMLLFVNPTFLQPEDWNKLWLFLTLRMDFPLTYQQLDTPFWTLAIEFQFYMLLPLIAAVMGRIVSWGSLKLRMVKLTTCLFVMFTWGMLIRYWGFKVADTRHGDLLVPHAIAEALRPYIFGTVGKFFESFALGMLVCMVYSYFQYAPVTKKQLTVVHRLSPLLFGLGVAILFLINIWHYYVIYMLHRTFHFLDPYQTFLTSYRDIFMQVGYSLGYACCLFGILHGPAKLKRPFAWAPLRWLGFISFSLYMWHYPFVLYFVSVLLPRFQTLQWSLSAQYSAALVWIAVTTIPLSVILYQCVERPGIRLGEALCRLLIRKKQLIGVGITVSPPVLVEAEMPVTLASLGRKGRRRR